MSIVAIISIVFIQYINQTPINMGFEVGKSYKLEQYSVAAHFLFVKNGGGAAIPS